LNQPFPGRWLPPALAAVLVAFTLWGAWFIYRTSFVIGGERWFVLFDDAMVSMAYARNLVEGYGLNWAREGAPVEGFTTPLWTAVMVPVNALPVPAASRSLIVQLLALAVLALDLVVVKRLTERFFAGGERRSWLPAVVLTAAYYPLNYWGLIGMETALQALLATGAVLLACEMVEEGSDRTVALAVVLALAYSTRMDMALLAAAVVGWVHVHGGFRATRRSRLALGAGIVVAAVLGYQLFRVLYFGAPLPNTYYLKLTGIPFEVRLLRGLATYADFFRAHALPLLVVILGAVPLWRQRRRYQLPLVLFGLYSLYSVYVGGDGWEEAAAVRANRFLAFVMPLVFVAFSGLLDELLSWLGGLLPRFSAHAGRYVAIAATALALGAANGLWFDPAAAEHWRNLVVAERPMLVPSHEIVLRDLRKLERVLAPGARVATFWAGVPAYFSDYRMVDMYGYSDAHVARLPSARPLRVNNYRSYRPGHSKWDYGHVFRDQRPDAFLQVWHVDDATLPAVMRDRGYRQVAGFWIRDGTPLLPPARADPPPG
jgi:hypothetical protein